MNRCIEYFLYMEIEPIFILVIFTTLIQSVIGVGILVIGTPFLLILNFHITDVIANLLPLSILTNLINLILQKKIVYENKDDVLIHMKSFFFYCVPSILIGIATLKIIDNQINLNLFIGLIILLSIYLKMFNKIHFLQTNNKFLLSIIGLIHGITNSGGTLLSVFLIEQKNNLLTRISIHFFYFLLASIQLLFFLLFFGFDKIIILNNFLYFFIIILILSILGNYISKKISSKFFNSIVFLMALITSVFLIFKEIII